MIINKEQTWNRIRKDEFVFNDKIIRMTSKKIKQIKEFDRRILEEMRYA